MTLFRKLLADRSGNFALITALIAVPLFGAVGLATDVTRAISIKADIQTAADAAALEAVSDFSVKKSYTSGGLNNASINAAKEQARKVFNAELANRKLSDVSITMEPSISQTGVQYHSQVTFHATMKTTFMRALNIRTLSVGGTAEASSLAPVFAQFHLLFDNSPSMGVAATQGEIARMESLTSDQCAFACHDLNNSNNYFNLARNNNVTLRFDLIKQAAIKIADTVTQARFVSNQYLLNLYTFGPTAEIHKDTPVTRVAQNLTDMSTFKSTASAIDLMTLPKSGYNNDMQTYMPQALTAMNGYIPTPGDGSSVSSPQQILMIVSDGVSDGYRPTGCTKQLTGTRCQEPLDPTFCDTIKARGVRIAVLYTTYLPLPSNGWYNYYIKPFQAEIPAKMEACASPGLYFEVSFSGGLSEAMQALFLKAINMPRLSS